MESKIIFLGTGYGPYVVGRQIRASGGIIIRTGGYQFYLDPGPGSLVRASQFGVNVRETTGVLVSDNNIYHANDVNALLSVMTYDGLDNTGVLICTKNLLDESFLSEEHKKYVERIIAPNPGQRIGIENIEIRALEAKNPKGGILGFKFYTPGFILSYAGNTGYSKEIIKQYEKSDIIILNMNRPDSNKNKDNMTIEDATKLIEKVKPSLVILTNFGKKMLDADPLLQARQLQKDTGIQILAADDGMIIDPTSYSANLKQKTLNLYPKTESREQKSAEANAPGETSGENSSDSPEVKVEPIPESSDNTNPS
jgi:ribonuclease BN (tRNA processing enzyme)